MAAEQIQEERGAVRLVTLSEVKEILEREQQSREDLNYEQKLALDHAIHFVRIPAEKSRELVAKLQELGGRVSVYYAHRIADILPTHPDDVKAIFAKERSVPDNEEIEKILAVVREYL